MKKFLIFIVAIFSLGILGVKAADLPQDIFEGDPAYAELQLCLQDPPNNRDLVCYEGFYKNVEGISTSKEMDFFVQNVCDGSWDYNRVCMMVFGDQVSQFADAINHCETIEERERGEYCKIYTIFYRENFSGTDLEELANVCSDTANLSDDGMEICYESFATKCGVKEEASPSICNEKMPIFFYHPYSGVASTIFGSPNYNYGYEIAQPEDINFCIERRSTRCIKELFLTLDEAEMESACDIANESSLESSCLSLMEKKLEEVKLEKLEEVSLQARERNEATCEEGMLNDYQDLFSDQEIEESLQELWQYKCASYAFWVEYLITQSMIAEEDELFQEFLEAWRHYLFLEATYGRDISKASLDFIYEKTKEGLEASKEKVEGYKLALEDAKVVVDEGHKAFEEVEGMNFSLISEDHNKFMDRADEHIENIDRSIYHLFNECPNNICELVEAEKAFKVEQSQPVFEDVSQFIPQSIAIRHLKKTNIVGGYPDGTFKPDDTINRVELLKIVVESQFDENSIENCISENTKEGENNMFFSDVQIGKWYAKYVCMGKIHGIIEGYPDGTFKTGDPVNRVEGIKIVMEALGFGVDDVEISVQPYGDTSADQWFTPYVFYGKQMAIFSNTSYSFKPGEDITRAEISEILYRLLAISELNEDKYDQELDIEMFQLSE